MSTALKQLIRWSAGGALAALLLVTMAIGCAQDPKPTKQELFNEGRTRYWRSQYSEAIGPFKAALTVDRSDPEILYHIGSCYEHLGDYREARFFYQRALTSFPGHGPSTLALESMNRRLDNPMPREFQPVTPPPPESKRYEVDVPEPRQTFIGGQPTATAPPAPPVYPAPPVSALPPAGPAGPAPAASSNSDSVRIMAPVPLASGRAGQPMGITPTPPPPPTFDEPETARPPTLDPQRPTVQNQASTLIDQARRFESQNNLEKALELYKQAVAVDPSQSYPHAELGRYYMRIGQNDQAIAELQKAQSINPAEQGVAEDLAKLGGG